jgi:hypothetical protein
MLLELALEAETDALKRAPTLATLASFYCLR